MVKSGILRWLAPVLLGAAVTGCGVVGGQASSGVGARVSKAAHTSAMTVATKRLQTTGASTLTGVPGDLLIGAAASPPTGSGQGYLVVDHIGRHQLSQIPLAPGANAFLVAVSGHMVYVPTLQGHTYVVSLNANRVVRTFASPVGARIATLAQAGHLLIITGPSSVTAYHLPTMRQAWQLHVGGNAMAVAGSYAYLSSNMADSTQVIDVATGQIVEGLPVGHIEDSAYDPQAHTLWLADWTNGDMTIVNTLTNQVVTTIQEAEGGGFSLSNMMGSSGGFMQITVGPSGRHVYAATFSGNILVYDAATNVFEKNIATNLPMAKLSGIAIDPSGQYAYVTVESLKETVSIALTTGQIASVQPNLMSNRWFTFGG